MCFCTANLQLSKETDELEINRDLLNYSVEVNLNDSRRDATESSTDTDVSYDLFAHLFHIGNNEDTTKMKSTTLCKDALAVDEFIDMLRNKLSTDNMLRDLLFTKSPNGDASHYTDPKVDAIVSKIYSQKTRTTSTKSTISEEINSTILADLVEAVIFRNRGKVLINFGGIIIRYLVRR